MDKFFDDFFKVVINIAIAFIFFMVVLAVYWPVIPVLACLFLIYCLFTSIRWFISSIARRQHERRIRVAEERTKAGLAQRHVAEFNKAMREVDELDVDEDFKTALRNQLQDTLAANMQQVL